MATNYRPLRRIAVSLTVASTWSTVLHADTPLGWINSDNPAAYTTTRGELELSLAGLAVNDTIDFLNFRDDLLAGNQRLVGDSGDLSGGKLELHYGVTEELSVFYRRQQHSLTLDLGKISSVDIVDIDTSLETTAESAGFKWTFYRANLLNPDNRQTAASLELSAFRNASDNFDVVLEQIRFDNVTIFFGIPQTFSIANLEDEGWKAKLIYTWPLPGFGTATVWAGYGESEATSGTTSDFKSVSISRFFKQDFQLEETTLNVGASLRLQITPRLTVSADYEFIRISDSKLNRIPITPPTQLPGFLTLNNQATEDTNHSASARLAYWLTPQLSMSLTGKLFSNQFIGVLPHYNNPLSASFASVPYGFAGIELGYKFRMGR